MLQIRRRRDLIRLKTEIAVVRHLFNGEAQGIEEFLILVALDLVLWPPLATTGRSELQCDSHAVSDHMLLLTIEAR